MNATPDFASLLSAPVDSFERPPLMPKGTYRGTLIKHEFGKSKNKGTPYVEFTARVDDAGPDINSADLKGVRLDGKTFSESFYLTPDAMYRLKEFLQSLGIKTEGRSVGEAIPDTAGGQVLMFVDHAPSQRNKDEFYARLTSMKGA